VRGIYGLITQRLRWVSKPNVCRQGSKLKGVVRWLTQGRVDLGIPPPFCPTPKPVFALTMTHLDCVSVAGMQIPLDDCMVIMVPTPCPTLKRRYPAG